MATGSTGCGGLLLRYHRTFTDTHHPWTTPPAAEKVKKQALLSRIIYFPTSIMQFSFFLAPPSVVFICTQCEQHALWKKKPFLLESVACKAFFFFFKECLASWWEHLCDHLENVAAGPLIGAKRSFQLISTAARSQDQSDKCRRASRIIAVQVLRAAVIFVFNGF